jgi:single-stranded DNA-binding protein
LKRFSMINEVLAVGRVLSQIDSGTTKNGFLRASARFEIIKERDESVPWKTWCTVFAFGKTAEALVQAGHGATLFIRGRLGWFQTEGSLGELAVQVRSFTRFKMPGEHGSVCPGAEAGDSEHADTSVSRG